MSNNQTYKIKIKMLTEFKKQLDEVFNNYSENLDLNDLISNLNLLRYVWGLCRIDLKNYGQKNNSILFDDGKKLHVKIPTWFTDDKGEGYNITTDKRTFKFSFKTINEGTLKLVLRGVFRKIKELTPVYINVTNLKVNNETIFNEDKLLWHNIPYLYEKKCKDNEEVTVQITFKTIFDYFPQINKDFRQIRNENDIHSVKKMHEMLEDYFACEKIFKEDNYKDNQTETLYNFYKENDLITPLNKETLSTYENFHKFYMINNNNKINSKMDLLSKRFTKYEKDYIDYVDSENFLFNTILVDYKLEPARLLNNLQTLCKQLLLFFDNICQTNDLKWWLDYGTLLGAIRHENFIPWDDDLDVGMMRNDYHKFTQVIYDVIKENNLDDYLEVAYRYRTYNGIQVNSFVQLFVKDLKHEGIDIMAGLDVVPYDYMKDFNKDTLGKQYNATRLNFYKRLTKGTDTSSIYMGLNPDEVMDEYFSQLNLTYDEEKYILPGVEGGFGYQGTNLLELVHFDTDEIFPLSKSHFGEQVFPVPNNSDSYLKKIYGDYLKVPKLIRTHGRTNVLREIPNINEKFEEYINIFKEVNEKY